MFGKLMSVSDELMWTYYELLTDQTLEAIAALRADVASGAAHPRTAKVDLAKRIITDFHSAEAAAEAEAEFDRVFVRKELPAEMRREALRAPEAPLLRRVLVDVGGAASMSDATRKLSQGAVRVNGAGVSDLQHRLEAGVHTVQVGKRFAIEVQVIVDSSGGEPPEP
jgi:tyrosyl-tRNA synthetase